MRAVDSFEWLQSAQKGTADSQRRALLQSAPPSLAYNLNENSRGLNGLGRP